MKNTKHLYFIVGIIVATPFLEGEDATSQSRTTITHYFPFHPKTIPFHFLSFDNVFKHVLFHSLSFFSYFRLFLPSLGFSPNRRFCLA